MSNDNELMEYTYNEGNFNNISSWNRFDVNKLTELSKEIHPFFEGKFYNESYNLKTSSSWNATPILDLEKIEVLFPITLHVNPLVNSFVYYDEQGNVIGSYGLKESSSETFEDFPNKPEGTRYISMSYEVNDSVKYKIKDNYSNEVIELNKLINSFKLLESRYEEQRNDIAGVIRRSYYNTSNNIVSNISWNVLNKVDIDRFNIIFPIKLTVNPLVHNFIYYDYKGNIIGNSDEGDSNQQQDFEEYPNKPDGTKYVSISFGVNDSISYTREDSGDIAELKFELQRILEIEDSEDVGDTSLTTDTLYDAYTNNQIWGLNKNLKGQIESVSCLVAPNSTYEAWIVNKTTLKAAKSVTFINTGASYKVVTRPLSFAITENYFIGIKGLDSRSKIALKNVGVGGMVTALFCKDIAAIHLLEQK